MKTPCELDPEAWVGDDKSTYAWAISECMTCPVLDACRAEAELNPPDFGVMAAVEYTKANQGPRSKACVNCGATFRQGKESIAQWTAKESCSRSCGSRIGATKKRAA